MGWSITLILPTKSTINDLVNECDPNVHTIRWIAITFLVTSCEFEERISTIGLVKSAKKILTGKCLMSAHRDMDINLYVFKCLLLQIYIVFKSIFMN